MYHTFLVTIFSILFLGCGGIKALEIQLKDAQRERDILRDAYEAQQLRLKELESRLLKIEDDDVGSTKSNVRMNRQVTSQRQRSSTKSKGLWPRERLRALPVVMVKRDQVYSKTNETYSEPKLELDEVQRRRRSRNPSVKENTRKKLVTTSVRQKQREVKKKTSLPSLNARNLSDYRDLDQVKKEQKIDRMKRTERQTYQEPSLKKYKTESRPRPFVERPKASSQPSVMNQIREQGDQENIDQAISANPISQGLQQAQTYRKQGRLKEAMRIAKRLIAESPTDPLIPNVLYLMGRLQIEQGQATAGRSTLLRLSRLYPKASAAKEAQQFLNLEGS